MTFSIGRFGLAPTMSREHSSWTMQGDNVTLDGWIQASTQADAEALRQQLIGTATSIDERVVPVQWARDGAATGFYSLLDCQVESVLGISYRSFRFKYGASLRRISGGYTAPKIESVMFGADRTNAYGGVTATPWHATPSTATSYDLAGQLPVPALRGGPGGYVYHYIDTDFYTTSPTWTIPVANWYDMASTITINDEIACGGQIVSNSSSWSLSNGLMKVTPGSGHLLDVTAPQAGALGTWGTGKGVNAGWWSTSFQTITSCASVIVLRNSPEESAVRLPVSITSGSGTSIVNVDISLRRGSRVASVRLSSPAATFRLGLGFSTATGSTELASLGGIRGTSDDSDTNRPVILCASLYTRDLTNGIVYLSTANHQVDMAIGHEVGGSGATAPDTALNIRDQWWAATNETQTVVAQ